MRFRKIEVSYLLFCFFRDFSFIYPVYMILFRAHGLSFVQISILMTIWAFSALVLEIPSGVLADTWSRKYTIAFGLVLKAAAFLAWLLLPSFSGFALGFILWGAMEAFCSGTTDALLFDALKTEGREDSFVKVAGLGVTATSISIALAMVAGGFLFNSSPGGVLMASSLSMIAAGLCILPLPENRDLNRLKTERTSGQPFGSFMSLVKQSKEMLAGHGMLLLLLFGSLVEASYGEVEEYDNLFGTGNGVPVALIGLWGALRFLLEGLGGFFAFRLDRALRLHRPGHLAVWMAGAGIFLFIGTLHFVLLPLYFLFYFMMASGLAVYQGVIQRRFESAGRATFSSIASSVFTGNAIALGLIFGVVAELRGLFALFRVAALVVAAVSVLFGIVVSRMNGSIKFR